MTAIAIANQKGGVGKTTITLGLAESAARLGLRVLVVDCDPQANATAGLGVVGPLHTISDILDNEVHVTIGNADKYIFPSAWTKAIDVLAADVRLASVEAALATDPIGAFDRLSRGLEGIKQKYDVIFFDCPPAIGLLTINALFAADEVIVVSAASAWSYDGVETFSQNVARIASRRGGKPKISGVVVNNVLRTRDSKYWQSEINEHFTFPLVSISARAAIAEAAASSSSIKGLGARAGAAEAMADFDQAFLTLIGIAGSSTPEVTTKQERRPLKVQSIATAI